MNKPPRGEQKTPQNLPSLPPLLSFPQSHNPTASPTLFAKPMNASARSLPGSATTVGTPRSASSHMRACSGISASRGILWVAQTRARLSVAGTSSEEGEEEEGPKMGVLVAQWGQVKWDMFWIRPRIYHGVLKVIGEGERGGGGDGKGYGDGDFVEHGDAFDGVFEG